MRQIIIAGNWKMNIANSESKALVKGVLADFADVNVQVVLCPAFVCLSQVGELVHNSGVCLGAQNLNSNDSGAFTGEVSAAMLKDVGVEYVIVGHSERRELYGESNEVVANKVQAALKNKLTPILCIGESLEQRNIGATETIIAEQINVVIDSVGIDAFNNIVVAYEPIWAIGSGISATPEQAQSVHCFIRELLGAKNADVAQSVSILYGGSMNPGNAKELISCADIDGGLIGGAALDAQSFLQICKSG